MKEIKQRLMAVVGRLSKLHKETEVLKKQIEDLENLGIINARLHWPKDKPGALELLYSSNSEYTLRTGRRRQYIGKDPQKQQAAKEAIERWRKHRKLLGQLGTIERHIYSIERRVDALEQVSKGYEVRW